MHAIDATAVLIVADAAGGLHAGQALEQVACQANLQQALRSSAVHFSQANGAATRSEDAFLIHPHTKKICHQIARSELWSHV